MASSSLSCSPQVNGGSYREQVDNWSLHTQACSVFAIHTDVFECVWYPKWDQNSVHSKEHFLLRKMCYLKGPKKTKGKRKKYYGFTDETVQELTLAGFCKVLQGWVLCNSSEPAPQVRNEIFQPTLISVILSGCSQIVSQIVPQTYTPHFHLAPIEIIFWTMPGLSSCCWERQYQTRVFH